MIQLVLSISKTDVLPAKQSKKEGKMESTLIMIWIHIKLTTIAICDWLVQIFQKGEVG